MTAFMALTRAQWHGFWRDKQNWFSMLAFPLMFLVLFGFLFRDAGASKNDIAKIGSVAISSIASRARVTLMNPPARVAPNNRPPPRRRPRRRPSTGC